MILIGIYVHIPFCVKKCAYCDFNSYDNKDSLREAYVSELIKEIQAFDAQGYRVDTIFFGGGTPTVLATHQLERILNTITKKFTLDQNVEISIESNPKTVEDYRPLKQMGFNRLSIGLQSANDEELITLGRIHTYADFEKSYEEASAVFSNINVDIMFSLPDQTTEKWENTLGRINALSPAHISCYSLKIEENTPFDRMNFILPNEETDRKMYRLAREMLDQYERYEISNFAKQGMQCKHNIKYWKRLPYAGFGAGAHSNIRSVRHHNIYDLEEYIRANNKVQEHALISLEDAMSEFVFLGMRMKEGIDKEDFYEQFQQQLDDIFRPALEKHLAIGTIALKNQHYYLTDYGIDVSNTVLCDFIK